jgi:hypothetical protein
MNKIGAINGNKETAKGREMERKHEADMKTTKSPLHELRIEIHRGAPTKSMPHGPITGHTLHAHMMPKKASPGGAFMEHTHESVPFDAKGQSKSEGDIMDHIADHLNMGGSEAAAGAKDVGGASESEEEEADGE